MRPISSLSILALGFISSWQIFLFWGSVYILIFDLTHKRQMSLALRNIVLLICFVNYTLFQCTVGYTSKNAVTKTMMHIVEQYAKLPALGLIGFCILLTVIEILLIYYMRHWYNTHITSSSIKEAIETLPVGICAFESSGKIILRNKTMEKLCRNLTDLPLLNGNEFVQALKEKNSNLTISLQDDSVWSFTKDEIQSEYSYFSLLIAYNVTEVHQKTKMLAKRQKKVQELNEKLLAYNKQIEHIITQQEILMAKVRIHDELGSGLLAIKHYLVSGGSDKERYDLLERLKNNIQFLQQEVVLDEQDEFELILSTAKDLGVSVKIDGVLPQIEPNKHILSTAIHECFTNILRHTNCDTLYVDIKENEHSLIVKFTDNNSQPIDDIVEIGGLHSLRDMVEHAKGEMNITTAPFYCLTIILPKEVEKYGL